MGIKRNYNLNQRLIAFVLFVGLLLQSCGGFQNQIVPQEEEGPSKTIELSDHPLINTDKQIVTSGGYLASFYEDEGELKADLKADEIQPEPNYKGVPVVVEEGTNLASLTKLDPTTQQSRIELNRSHSGQLRHITIRKGGLSGGMMGKLLRMIGYYDVDYQEKEKEEEKEKEKEKENLEEEYDLCNVKKVDYISGNFQYKEKDMRLYAPPFRPSQASQQFAEIYGEHPEVFPDEQEQEELVLMRIKKDKDGRQRINNTTEWPYFFNAQLSISYGNREYGGSGILVGPQHILTAAHNIYNKDRGWANKVAICLGLNDDIAPYGKVLATRFYTFKPWINQQDKSYDMAMLVLENPVGLNIGWCGLLAASENELLEHEVHITGYPGDKGLKQMWTMSHKLKEISPSRLIYEIDTYPGQSGSGIWIDKWDSPYVVGVHTLGEGPEKLGNSGVRLSYTKAKQITRWINETLSSKQSIDKSPSTTKNDNQDKTSQQMLIKGPKILNLVNQQVDDEQAIIISSNLNLISLNLENNNIGDKGAKALACHPGLTSLNLRNNKIGDEGAKALACHPGLTSLNLRNNKIGDKGAKALAHNTTLKSLSLRKNREIRKDGFEELSRNSTLTSLDLWGTEICDPKSLEGPFLDSIILPEKGIRNFQLHKIIKQDLSKIHTINLAKNKFDSDQGIAILASGNFSCLATLDLSHNLIYDTSVSIIAQTAKFSTLSTLDLRRHWVQSRFLVIRTKGAEALASGQLCQLTYLNLENNRIEPNGVKAIAVANFTNLKYLNLYGNNVQDEGVQGLMDGHLTNLTDLNLGWSSITNQGAKILGIYTKEKFAALTLLNLTDNKEITEEGKNELKSNIKLIKLY